jgi:hypothetical protein
MQDTKKMLGLFYITIIFDFLFMTLSIQQAVTIHIWAPFAFSISLKLIKKRNGAKIKKSTKVLKQKIPSNFLPLCMLGHKVNSTKEFLNTDQTIGCN